MAVSKRTLATGVNLIVENFLLNHLGETPKDMNTGITEDWVVVFIRGLLHAGDEESPGPAGGVESCHALRMKLFEQSEQLLNERLACFLRRRIRNIRYLHGTRRGDMNIVVSLESS